jgi:two-component system, OmpR family, phosphate regulon response regulator OmpR
MQHRPAKIHIVDDDARMRSMLERYLQDQEFSVTSAADGRRLERTLSQQQVDLVVLDLMLPGEDGLALCQRLRSSGIDPRELVARIKAVLRRRPSATHRGAPAADEAVVAFGGYQLNLGTRMLHKGGEVIALTTGEFAVLEALVKHPRQTLSRERLAELSRGRELGLFDRSMDVQISRLRRLIEEQPAAPRYIQTVRGLGYVFVPDGAEP